MSRLIVIPSNKKMIYDLIDKVDGFIIGVNKLSVNLPCTFSIDEVITIIDDLNIKNKDIFVSLNKNMHDKDLVLLKDVLLKLNEYKITGVMYYDISIVNLKNKLNLQYDLVWSQEHLTTSLATVNYWYDKGIKYTYLSSEITKREVIEIKDSTKSKLMVNIFGYIPMFTSGRHLVDNYLKTFKKTKNNSLYYIEKEDKTYPVIDNEEGTITYSDYVLNGLKEYDQLDVDYMVFNSFLINDFEKIIDIVNNKESYERINDIVKNNNDGFLYKETIYKVK